ncbi:hypothetical protein BIW11_00888 [Tropilaelaps mercedesae]|uniref:Uncharacterized protein n=1 Tax=Tropilaelaps mercedesae TaxID=418985 RepID=A0A1V9XMU0_9ACAR|nr:hypothetical protein BIW11_00888 [Tropilaelaps mercedesae]
MYNDGIESIIHGTLSLEAELGSASKNHPVTVDPLQNLDDDGPRSITEKPSLPNSEYYDDLYRRATTTVAPPTTQEDPSFSAGSVGTTEDVAWPVDDPYLSPPGTTEPPNHTVGPEDILIQDAKPGIPLLATDLNSLKLKTNHNHQQGANGASNKVDSMPAPVFRPEAHTTHNAEAEAKKKATQDEDDISAGAGAIHFQPIQTKEGDSKTTGNAQLYHAYYAPAHHDPPPGYIRMTVDEFNKLFKDAEIQFIGSEQELQKKLGTKPTNKLNFDINATSASGSGNDSKRDKHENDKEDNRAQKAKQDN